jgi:hypothetical protein
MMNNVSWFITGLLVLFVVFGLDLTGCEKSSKPEIKPSIYITRTDHFRTLNGEMVWILEYTIDGHLQTPAFPSQEAMAEYREYLNTIGTVYRNVEERQ